MVCVCVVVCACVSVCVSVCVRVSVAAQPSKVWLLPSESIMGLSPSSPLEAWYGVGLGRFTVSLHTHTYTFMDT